MTSATSYAVRYASRGARNGYVVSMVASGIAALAGVATGQWELLVPAVGIALFAERIRPYVGEHAQINLDTDGMTLRGLGFLPWRTLADARAFEHATPGGVRVWLMLELADEIERADRAGPARLFSALRRFQIRPWRLVGGRGLIVRLEDLDSTPDAIRRAFETYSNRRIAVDRV